MRRLVKAAAIVAVLSSGRASAAPTPVGATPVVLVAIDSVEVTGTTIVVAGVEEGAGAPSEWSISFYVTSSDTFAMGQLEACHRMALAAMTRHLISLSYDATMPSLRLLSYRDILPLSSA